MKFPDDGKKLKTIVIHKIILYLLTYEDSVTLFLHALLITLKFF